MRRSGMLAVVVTIVVTMAATATAYTPVQQIVEYQIGGSTSDAAALVTESGYSLTTAFWPSSNTDRRTFMRWQLKIPPGATIDAAYLKVCSTGGAANSDPSTVRLQLLDEDDCAAFSANPFARDVTAGYVDWVLPGQWTGGQWYTSPDIGDIVREFIARPGSGFNDFMGIRGLHQAGGYKRIYQYDYDDTLAGRYWSFTTPAAMQCWNC